MKTLNTQTDRRNCLPFAPRQANYAKKHSNDLRHALCSAIGMAKWDLRERTMNFAVATFTFCRTLPRTDESRDIVRQLRRASSSVASNYRAMRRSQSDGVFITKAAAVIEEADETAFWLELLVNVGVVQSAIVSDVRREADELVAIFTASRKTVRARMDNQRGALQPKRRTSNN